MQHDRALTLTNIVLALLVIGAVLYVVSGPLLDWVARLRKRRAYEAELNHDMEEMFPRHVSAAVAAPPARPHVLRRLLSWLRAAVRRLTNRPGHA
jgi:hypothetical protein